MSGKDELKFFNPWGEVDVSRNRLPHWQQKGVIFFVTWRLADSLPQDKLRYHYEERLIWRKTHPEPWTDETEAEYHRLFSARVDDWLDTGHGECVLRESANAEIVANALLHFEGTRSVVASFVIMPNHVHILFALDPEWRLEELIHSWKRFSSQRINQRIGRSGTLWHRDYFDRLIRDGGHFENCIRYIRRNPEKARLKTGDFFFTRATSRRA